MPAIRLFRAMDEVLFIAGQSSLRLAETGGKQKTKKVMPNDMLAKERQATKYKTPEELREDARVYFSRLVAGYPAQSVCETSGKRTASAGWTDQAGRAVSSEAVGGKTKVQSSKFKDQRPKTKDPKSEI